MTKQKEDAFKLKFAKTEVIFVDELKVAGVVAEPFFKETRVMAEEENEAASPEDAISLAPRCTFNAAGVLVTDAKYRAGIDGIVAGASVFVKRVIAEGTKRRKVLCAETGKVVQVSNDGVPVDFRQVASPDEVSKGAQPALPDEVLVPRTFLSLVETPKKTKKPEQESCKKKDSAKGCQPRGCQSGGG